MDPTSYVSLEKSQDGGDLYRSHQEVVQHHTPRHVKMEGFYDNVRGKQWTDEEEGQFKRKKKTPIVLNQLLSAQRTLLGLFIQNKYDVKFAPREADDQDMSDILQKFYAFTAYSQGWANKDIQTVSQAWTGGVGYQEVYVKVSKGAKPELCTNNLNPFSVFWDPESRHLITRDDAEFVDVDTWVTHAWLQEFAPEKFKDPTDMATPGESGYTTTKVYADRSAQYFDTKNNRFKVTERLYKVRKKVWYAMDPDWNRIDIKNPDERGRYEQEGYEVFSEHQEFLNLAMLCPAWNKEEYLYNDAYHCQPRDVHSGKILWPIVELVAESLNGDPSGFAEHLINANRLINSAVSNVFHANKHASSTSLLRKPKLFGKNEVAARDFDKNHTDADKVFTVSDAADLATDIAPTPKGFISTDTYKTYEIGDLEFQKLSSTPPSLQGQTEQGASGILNGQRIEQAFTQLQPLIANVKAFLAQRAKLVQYYWREYWTFPMTFRLVGESGQAKYAQLNQDEQETDYQGRLTGNLKKVNDLSVATYDIDIEDSYQSPTYRAKVQQQLSDIMTKGGGNIDPVLLEILFAEYANSTDMSQTIKDKIKGHMEQKAQQAQQPAPPPPPEPPKFNFSFKGEDLMSPGVLAILEAHGGLPPEILQQLKAGAQGGVPGDQPDPVAQDKHAMEREVHAAKMEGHQLDNAKKMQGIAEDEANVLTGYGPSAAKSLKQRPTAFSPMGAR